MIDAGSKERRIKQIYIKKKKKKKKKGRKDKEKTLELMANLEP